MFWSVMIALGIGCVVVTIVTVLYCALVVAGLEDERAEEDIKNYIGDEKHDSK